MLRVAMVAYTYYSSDPRVRREAEALAARGDKVDFYCLRKEGDPSEEWLDGVRVIHLPQIRYRGGSTVLYTGSYVRFFFRALFALGAAHLRNSYDIVHANNMPDFMAFTGLVPRLGRKPMILDIHDTMPEIYQGKFRTTPNHPLIRLLRFQERISARFAGQVMTSEHTKKEALIIHGMKAESIEVLLNLPDPRIFIPGLARRQERSRDSVFRLVYHGTLAERLGVDIALRALAIVKQELPAVRFDVIGDGDHLPELHALAAELDIEDVVRFSDGFVPVEELPEMLKGADLALIPTRTEISTRYMLPTKLVEYSALGIPAIVSPTYTIKYYFDEDQVAYFEDGKPETLAAEILKLHRDVDRRDRLAEGAARFFEQYNWDSHKQVYLDLVDRLCGV
ncbi:MAG: glycosyltransferase family 4 protein [bacterium]|nr:glycosyltransferase family 4 protein [bacterium]